MFDRERAIHTFTSLFYARVRRRRCVRAAPTMTGPAALNGFVHEQASKCTTSCAAAKAFLTTGVWKNATDLDDKQLPDVAINATRVRGCCGLNCSTRLHSRLRRYVCQDHTRLLRWQSSMLRRTSSCSTTLLDTLQANSVSTLWFIGDSTVISHAQSVVCLLADESRSQTSPWVHWYPPPICHLHPRSSLWHGYPLSPF